MAQPKQETSSTPAPASDASDALGAQVDALLDELEHAAESLQAEAEIEPAEQAPADAAADEPSADGGEGGFEQSMFTKPPPAGAPSATRSESRAKDPPPVQSSGGPSGKTHAEERLSAANNAAPKHEQTNIPDEKRPQRAAPAAVADEPVPEKQRSSEIKKLDEHLADTASNHLDDEVETLLNQGPGPGGNSESPSDHPGAADSDALDASKQAEAPTASSSQPPAANDLQSEPVASDSAVQSPQNQQPVASNSQPAARNPGVAEEPAPKAPPPGPARSAAESLSDSRVVVLVGGEEPTESTGAGLITKAGVGLLRVISAPLSLAPVGARDALGYLALVTLFNAAALWTLLLLRN